MPSIIKEVGVSDSGEAFQQPLHTVRIGLMVWCNGTPTG